MGKTVNFYLVKVNRLVAWCLLVVVIIYLCSGLALCGEFGFDRLIQSDTARVLHKSMVWPLIVLFVPHSVISAYFAFRRWGWIGTRTKS